MKQTKYIFLRHADTKKDPSINVKEWILSENGMEQAELVSKMPVMNEVEVIYASSERKTFLTVEPLAVRLDKKIHTLEFFDEVKRGEKFFTKEEFEKEKSKQLIDLQYKAFSGESGTDALDRFKNGVSKVGAENEGKTVLIVTHGTILNIYFADLLNLFTNLPERWSKTSFCAVGIVQNEKVLQDIIFS